MNSSFQYHRQQFSNGASFEFCIPNSEEVKANYERQLKENPNTPFPYWAKVWDAAIVLSDYILNTNCCDQKRVVEFGCGLGLPSIVAAYSAKTVLASDKDPNCEIFIQESARINHLDNIRFQKLDWTKQSYQLDTDLVLLSDINYEPEIFDQSIALISYFSSKGIPVLLTTPHRLSAREFVRKLEPLIQEHIIVSKEELSLSEPVSLLRIG